VLRGASLCVQEGEMLSIVGKSGVGKSTFLHVAGTLDPPSQGRVQYWGKEVFDLPEAELARFRNRNIGFIFQFHHLLPEFNALENVMMPALVGKLPFAEARDRALGLLEQVELIPRLTHRPGELSGGEQQRVAIARALVMRPHIVFADEPTGNLDEKTSEAVHELLLRLNRELGVALVVVTHNLALAGRMKNHYLLTDGAIQPSETIREKTI
jgi:lipoprotein-releasing system ATP-binding protein